MSLLLKDEVFIEDNGWFLDGPFTEYAMAKNSVIPRGLKEGFIKPVVRFSASSFEELSEEIAKLGANPMGIAQERLPLARFYDSHLPKGGGTKAFRRIPDSEIGRYDDVLQRVLLGDAPTKGVSTVQRANIMRIWNKSKGIREAWLDTAFQERDQKKFKSASKSSFVRSAASQLGAKNITDSTKLFALRNESRDHQDFIQIVKWAMDAYYIARGETLMMGYSIYMPTAVDAAMIIKAQSKMTIPGQDPFSIETDVFMPTFETLSNTDPAYILRCRKEQGATFMFALQRWAFLCSNDNKESAEAAKELCVRFEEYAKALRLACADGGAGDPVVNFKAKWDAKPMLQLIPSGLAIAQLCVQQYMFLDAATSAASVAAKIVIPATPIVIGSYLRTKTRKRKTHVTVGSETGVCMTK